MAYILKAHLYRAQNNDILYAQISWQLLRHCRPRGLLADTPIYWLRGGGSSAPAPTNHSRLPSMSNTADGKYQGRMSRRTPLARSAPLGCWPSLPDWQETQLPALASLIRRLRLGAGLKPHDGALSCPSLFSSAFCIVTASSRRTWSSRTFFFSPLVRLCVHSSRFM